MKTKSPWITFLALLSGIFITLEAATFVSPALPYISEFYGISTANASIITVAYYITAISFAPLLGRLGDQRGRKKIILIGLILFSTAEFIAALSPNIVIFIIGRFLQGIGYACIFPNVFAYIPELFDETKRGKAIGLFMLITYIATGSGGILSGILINNFGWKSIFVLSGSLAFIGFFIVLLSVPSIVTHKKHPVDLLGATTLMLTITSIITIPLAISNFGLTSPFTIGLAILAVILLTTLILIERKVEFPVVDFNVLKIRGVSISSLLITFQNVNMISILFTLTFFAASKPGWSALEVGLITTVNYSIAAIISPLVGQFLDKYKPVYLVFFALISSMIGAGIFSFITMESTLLHLLLVVVFIGICSGCLNASLMKIIINEAPEDKKGVGTGTFGLFKDLGIPLGSTFGLTLFGAAKSTGLEKHLTEIADDAGVAPSQIPQVIEASQTGQVPGELLQSLNQLGIQFESLLAQANALSTSSVMQTVGIVNLSILVVITIISFGLIKRKKAMNTASQEDTMIESI